VKRERERESAHKKLKEVLKLNTRARVESWEWMNASARAMLSGSYLW
jgi:hypothetical protein